MLRKLIKLLSWWLLLKLSSYLLTPNSFQSLYLSLYIYICCFTHLHSCLQSFSESTVFSRMILNLPTLEPRGDNCSFFALQSLSESIADFSWMIFNLGWSPSTAIEFVFVFCFFVFYSWHFKLFFSLLYLVHEGNNQQYDYETIAYE